MDCLKHQGTEYSDLSFQRLASAILGREAARKGTRDMTRAPILFSSPVIGGYHTRDLPAFELLVEPRRQIYNEKRIRMAMVVARWSDAVIPPAGSDVVIFRLTRIIARIEYRRRWLFDIDPGDH